MAFVGEFEVVDDLPHLPHLVNHRPRLRDGAPRGVRSETVRGAVTPLNQPSAAGDDVANVPASQVAVAQAAPGASVPRTPAVVRREDREALRGQELEPRVPFVQRLRLRAPVWVDDGGVAAAFFSRHKEPSGNLSVIEARVPDELSVREFVLRKRLSKTVEQGGGPLSLPEDKSVRLRERGMVIEQALAIWGPQGPVRRSLRGRDRAGALAVSGDDLQLDVPIVVLEERDPLSVWRPEGHRLVPSIRDDEADALRLDTEHPDVQVIVDVRYERQFPAVRGPRFRSAEVASERILRLSESDDVL